MSDQRFTITADASQAENEIKELRAQIAATQRAMREFGGNETSMRGFVQQIDVAQAKIRELQLVLAGVATTTQALTERVRVPFAAIGAEIDRTISATDKWTASTRNARVEAEQWAKAQAAGQTGIRGIDPELGNLNALRLGNDALAAKERFLKASANDAAIYYAEIKKGEQVERQAKTAAIEGEQELKAARAAAAEAHAQLNRNLVNDAAQQVARERQIQIALGATAQGHRNVGAAAQAGSQVALDGSEQVISGFRRLITFFDALSRGQRGQFMATIGAAMKDAGLNVAALASSFGVLVVAFGAFKAISTLSAWNRELSEAATKQANLAAAAGIDAVQFGQLGAAMKLAGGNAETSIRAFEALEKQMSAAVGNPNGPQMQAFRQLGIEWTELRDQLSQPGGVLVVLDEIADAYKRIGQSASGNAAFTQLFGVRQLAEIIPAIKGGSEELRKMKAEGVTLGGVLTHEMLDKYEEGEHKIKRMEEAWLGFKIAVTSGNMFQGITDNLTKLGQDLTNLFTKGQLMDDAWQKAHPGGQTIPNPSGGGQYGSPVPGIDVRNGLRSGGASLEGVEPSLATKAQNLIEFATSKGVSLGILSGFRTREHQVGLWAEGLAKYGSPEETRKHVAPPGSSMHNEGRAIDFSGDLSFAHRYGGQFGLDFPVPGDPMHAEEIGNRARGAVGTTNLAGSSEGLGVSVPPKGPFDSGEAEKYYLKTLEVAEALARVYQRESEVNKIIAERQKYLIQDPTQRAKQLQADPRFNLDKEQGAEAVQLATAQAEANVRRAEQERKAFDAEMAQFEERKVRAKGDAKAIEAIEAEEAQVRIAFAQATAAEKIQAGTQVLRAGQAATAQTIREAEMELAANEKTAASKLRAFEAVQKAAREKGQITAVQEYNNNVMKAVELEKELEAELNKINATPGILKDQAQALDEKLKELRAQLVAFQEQQAEKATASAEKVAKAWAEPFQKAFSNISTGVESALTGALTRSETPKAAIKKLFEAGVKDAVDVIGTTLSKVIAKSFMNATAGETMGQMFSKMLGHLFESEAPLKLVDEAGKLATAANTVSTTANTAALAANTAGQASGAVGSAAGGIGGIFGFIPKLFGLFAAQGAIVPSAAGGMIAGGGSLAILHPREMVLPAYLSTGFQSIMRNSQAPANTNNNSTNGTVNYSPTINGGSRMSKADMTAMLRDHGDMVTRHVQNHFRNNGSLRFAR